MLFCDTILSQAYLSVSILVLITILKIMNEKLFNLEVRLKSFFTMKTRFLLHGYTNSFGETQILFSVTINKERKRIPTGYYINPKDWNAKTQRTKKNDDLNLVLDNMIAKSIDIQTYFKLSDKMLSLDAFLTEFFSKSPSYDFISFMQNRINELIENPNTKKKHNSICKKLRDYKGKLPFNAIDLDFFKKYRNHLANIGNNKSTINSNIKVIKYHLIAAQKKGIAFSFHLDDLVAGSCSGNRTSLSVEQVKKLLNYFNSGYCKDNWSISLGYFLVSCFTGLRVSDVLALRRKDLNQEVIRIKMVKTRSEIPVKISKRAREIITYNPQLFNKFYKEQTINKHLRDIAKYLGIYRKISMHIGRHTFATSYIRAGGDVVYLQKILGHRKLETTMIYTHISEDEAIETVNILDDMF